MKAAFLLRVLSATMLLVIVFGKQSDQYSPEDPIEGLLRYQHWKSTIAAHASINGPWGNLSGIVVSSRLDPDYWYTWTRTAALTFKMIINYLGYSGDPWDIADIDKYIKAGGLGEPKFHVNATAFTGTYNRPQQDGPALRATALTMFARNLLATLGNGFGLESLQYIQTEIWPIIRNDLEHTVRYWNTTSFDLWEDTQGSSFFTLSASHRALVDGSSLATATAMSCDGCAVTAPRILCFLESFWTGTYIKSNLNAGDSRSGIDASTIISSIHTHDPNAGCTSSTFQPCSSRALANHKTVTDSFRIIYPINSGIPQGHAIAVGRYPEDEDHGGNPWYVTTIAAAHQLYLARLHWIAQGAVTIDRTSLPFFRDLLPTISIGTHKRHYNSTYESILSAVHNYANGYMAVVLKYTPPDGSLSEQFDRNNGIPLSAPNFTWSHVAFHEAFAEHDWMPYYSWGAPLNHALTASQCKCYAHITFNVRVKGAGTFFVVGSVAELGSWDKDIARQLSRVASPSYHTEYSVQIDVPASTSIQYRYFMRSLTSSGHHDIIEDNSTQSILTGGCGSNRDTPVVLEVIE